MPNELVPVKFHEDTIYYVDYDGEQLVPMRPVIENMGLSWQAQHAKLLSAGNRWSVTMILTVAQDGKARDRKRESPHSGLTRVGALCYFVTCQGSLKQRRRPLCFALTNR